MEDEIKERIAAGNRAYHVQKIGHTMPTKIGHTTPTKQGIPCPQK